MLRQKSVIPPEKEEELEKKAYEALEDELKHTHQRVIPLQTSLSLRTGFQGNQAAMLLVPERTTSMASLVELASIQGAGRDSSSGEQEDQVSQLKHEMFVFKAAAKQLGLMLMLRNKGNEALLQEIDFSITNDEPNDGNIDMVDWKRTAAALQEIHASYNQESESLGQVNMMPLLFIVSHEGDDANSAAAPGSTLRSKEQRRSSGVRRTLLAQLQLRSEHLEQQLAASREECAAITATAIDEPVQERLHALQQICDGLEQLLAAEKLRSAELHTACLAAEERCTALDSQLKEAQARKDLTTAAHADDTAIRSEAGQLREAMQALERHCNTLATERNNLREALSRTQHHALPPQSSAADLRLASPRDIPGNDATSSGEPLDLGSDSGLSVHQEQLLKGGASESGQIRGEPVLQKGQLAGTQGEPGMLEQWEDASQEVAVQKYPQGDGETPSIQSPREQVDILNSLAEATGPSEQPSSTEQQLVPASGRPEIVLPQFGASAVPPHPYLNVESVLAMEAFSVVERAALFLNVPTFEAGFISALACISGNDSCPPPARLTVIKGELLEASDAPTGPAAGEALIIGSAAHQKLAESERRTETLEAQILDLAATEDAPWAATAPEDAGEGTAQLHVLAAAAEDLRGVHGGSQELHAALEDVKVANARKADLAARLEDSERRREMLQAQVADLAAAESARAWRPVTPAGGDARRSGVPGTETALESPVATPDVPFAAADVPVVAQYIEAGLESFDAHPQPSPGSKKELRREVPSGLYEELEAAQTSIAALQTQLADSEQQRAAMELQLVALSANSQTKTAPHLMEAEIKVPSSESSGDEATIKAHYGTRVEQAASPIPAARSWESKAVQSRRVPVAETPLGAADIAAQCEFLEDDSAAAQFFEAISISGTVEIPDYRQLPLSLCPGDLVSATTSATSEMTAADAAARQLREQLNQTAEQLAEEREEVRALQTALSQGEAVFIEVESQLHSALEQEARLELGLAAAEERLQQAQAAAADSEALQGTLQQQLLEEHERSGKLEAQLAASAAPVHLVIRCQELAVERAPALTALSQSEAVFIEVESQLRAAAKKGGRLELGLAAAEERLRQAQAAAAGAEAPDAAVPDLERSLRSATVRRSHEEAHDDVLGLTVLEQLSSSPPSGLASPEEAATSLETAVTATDEGPGEMQSLSELGNTHARSVARKIRESSAALQQEQQEQQEQPADNSAHQNSTEPRQMRVSSVHSGKPWSLPIIKDALALSRTPYSDEGETEDITDVIYANWGSVTDTPIISGVLCKEDAADRQLSLRCAELERALKVAALKVTDLEGDAIAAASHISILQAEKAALTAKWMCACGRLARARQRKPAAARVAAGDTKLQIANSGSIADGSVHYDSAEETEALRAKMAAAITRIRTLEAEKALAARDLAAASGDLQEDGVAEDASDTCSQCSNLDSSRQGKPPMAAPSLNRLQQMARTISELQAEVALWKRSSQGAHQEMKKLFRSLKEKGTIISRLEGPIPACRERHTFVSRSSLLQGSLTARQPLRSSPLLGSKPSHFCLLTRRTVPDRKPKIKTCAIQIDNRELLVGDCLALTSFCLYKQITSLLFLPDFPGWIAPLHFNPVRFEELLIFIFTLCVSWVSACGILGGYKTVATSDLPTALARVSGAWLIAMPVAACNLILVTAAEGNDLVGDSFFGHVLPLAARGTGEPFVTAAGVLGLMAVWRAFYTVFLDFWNVRTFSDQPINRYQDMSAFLDALRSAFLMGVVASCNVSRHPSREA
ncbi:hypothetical protein WJX75_007948 [Coccomyxa subellipsoidea]|uniref:Uncharacterized protein n=1 Tax=Coccomyxa subellipsoidea TaxID=248742 RepID=A0ABR2YSW7_9CHLO